MLFHFEKLWVVIDNMLEYSSLLLSLLLCCFNVLFGVEMSF